MKHRYESKRHNFALKSLLGRSSLSYEKDHNYFLNKIHMYWWVHNSSSKLSVASRLVAHWYWLCVFCAFYSFTDSLSFIQSCFVDETSPLVQSVLFPRPYWYFEILQRGFEGVFVAFLLATLRALSLHRKLFFGSRSSGNLKTCPVHLSCASFKTLCMLCIPAFFRTSVSGIFTCHLVFLTAFSNSLSVNG